MKTSSFRTLSDFLRAERIGSLEEIAFPESGVAHYASIGVAAQSLWVAARFLKNSLPILVIVKDLKFVDLWIENLSEQVPAESLLVLPSIKSDSKLFFGALEERLKFIMNAQSGNRIVVATAESLKTGLPSRRFMEEQSLRLKVGCTLESESLRELFISKGFEEQPVVEAVGDFSIRGCIIDINPLLSEHPVRIELWGNTVESIRTFDVFSQRSIESLQSVDIFPMNIGEEGGNTGFDFLENYSVVTEDYYNLPLDFSSELAKHSIVDFSPLNQQEMIVPQVNSGSGFASMEAKINEFSALGGEVCIVAPTQGQALRLYHLAQGTPVKEVLVGHISEGFWCADSSFAMLSEHQIFNRFGHLARKKQKSSSLHAAVLSDSLTSGDFVVHQDYGIGRYLGLSRIEAMGANVDCVMLEYADKTHLTFPMGDLYKIEKVSLKEDGSVPALNRIGNKMWEQAKERAKKRIAQIARALVDLYAKRELVKSFAFPPGGNLQDEFENDFPFSPTPDQAVSAKDIKADMEKTKPMDRLLCGDVGFGKTEVAMRAIFKCVCAKKQAAVLVPTTVLAAQHFHSFEERFAGWAVNIALVNRYKNSAEKREIYKKLKSGDIDLVIGTHALLSERVQFKDLGLLVIDEEQKFGVKQKEKLREMRLALHTLSMSATPIPRTLQLSMTGVRDISFINTPPLNRRPVETRIIERDNAVIAAAIRSEIERGGQAFVVNDRVNGIEELAVEVETLVPNARVAIAHAQMPDSDLEKNMSAFMNRKFDVLVCTVLIESGLDVPNANTIIIMNAHHFGVGQLYQLRGRVGRAAVQATAYLVTPKGGVGVTKAAKQRLAAMERYTDLGAGYQVAMRDLEIRGAGNLLGMEQHGFIEEIGYETYIRMVKEAVEEIRGEKDSTLLQPRLELRADAYLPESWIQDGLARISVYQRIAKAERPEEITAMSDELRDRFGPIPLPAQTLLISAKIGILAARFMIQGIARKQGVIAMTFSERATLDPKTLVEMQAKSKYPMRFLQTSPMQAVIEIGSLGAEKEIEELLEFLGGEGKFTAN